MSFVHTSEERNNSELSTDSSAAKQTNCVSVTSLWFYSFLVFLLRSVWDTVEEGELIFNFVISSTALGRCCLDVSSLPGSIQLIVILDISFPVTVSIAQFMDHMFDLVFISLDSYSESKSRATRQNSWLPQRSDRT